MATTGPRWQVEFLAVDGVEPARRWFDGLGDTTKQNAVIAAIEHVLIPDGIGVCASEWGRSLGGGLFELRIRHAAAPVAEVVRPAVVEDEPAAVDRDAEGVSGAVGRSGVRGRRRRAEPHPPAP